MMNKFDLGDYIGCHCVYLIEIDGVGYKYGITNNIVRRRGEHRAFFARHNAGARFLRVWRCNSIEIAILTEKDIDNYARIRELNIRWRCKREILKPCDIAPIIKMITDTVNMRNFGLLELEQAKIAALYAEISQLREELRRPWRSISGGLILTILFILMTIL